MSTRTLALAALLVSCVPPEEGIDDTRIRGTVRAVPYAWAESDEWNNGDVPEEVPLAYGYTLVQGTIVAWDWNPPAHDLGEDADEDWYAFTAPGDASAVWEVGPLDGMTDDTRILFEVYDLDLVDEEGAPTLLAEAYVGVDGLPLQLPVELTGGTRYGLRVGGGRGEGELAYTVAVQGLDPSLAGVIVGAWLPTEAGEAPEVGARGNPVAGASVGPFAPLDDGSYSFEASYEMLLVRSVVDQVDEDTGDDEIPQPIVDESIESVWLFAGDWSVLNAALPAGTWYSGTPTFLPVNGPRVADAEDEGVEYVAADPVQVDSIAPIIIGWQVAEVEPNDVPMVDDWPDLTDPSLAQDLGLMSGPGLVDILTGASTIGSTAAGWVHDIDAFAFQVPVPLEIFFVFDWAGDSATDLDIVLLDAAGEVLDHGATAAKPEVNNYGGAVLVPEETYFLVVMGYAAPAPGDVPWELTLEHAPR